MARFIMRPYSCILNYCISAFSRPIVSLSALYTPSFSSSSPAFPRERMEPVVSQGLSLQDRSISMSIKGPPDSSKSRHSVRMTQSFHIVLPSFGHFPAQIPFLHFPESSVVILLLVFHD